ncbi:DUF6528 family protein [Chitinophaga arvensicola]|uniref:PQQ-like domain-containing protein n=1 Tax=Chitinophaga arvensicola TaxID=29529 RepID=A0A1I0RIE1_9BACT|nr:DUF6528 family protein [Chitinophaga arvensicola]SEW40696.1 hypothetical protein SAMN04488122_2880 [Chitinophaga arvensicola]
MKKKLYLLTILLAGLAGVTYAQNVLSSCRKCIVIAEQSQHRIVIADLSSGAVIWEWKPEHSNVQPAHVKWFSNPSDAKMVYNNEYVLMNASGGGVALIRVADRKAVFYAYAGGNTHSAELLPDGNIVSASSTGNYLMLFKTDTIRYPDSVYTKKVPIDFGHNVVWDKEQQLLWSAARNHMHAFRYNFNCETPDLLPDTVFALPGTEAHDLFPVYGENNLWLTNTTHVYKFDVATRQLKEAAVLQADIKSISSAGAGLPTILIRPKESWWTDEVLDATGRRLFIQKGWKIYKARWVIPNTFSYPANDQLHLCM